jgi:hypothetical protein
MALLNKPVVAGADVTSMNPRDLTMAWSQTRGGPVQTTAPNNRLAPPTAPVAKTPFSVTAGRGGNMASTGPSNPFSQALANVNAGGNTITATPKSASQNAFTQALQDTFRQNQAANKGTLTQFVKDAYAGQAENKKALDQESEFLKGIFDDTGVVNELANSRAQRRAGVMMATKMAMDRAQRDNNVARMMRGGNSSYLDRAYGSELARIAAQAAIQDADLMRDDIRYVQGERTGALGARDRLLQNYLQTSALPYRFQQEMFGNDLNSAQGLAALENQNTIYETPEQRLMREIRMAEGRDHLQSMSDNFNAPVPVAQAPVPIPSPTPAPVAGSSYVPQPSPPQAPVFFNPAMLRVANRLNGVRFAV